jgi:hypothetical protein
MQKIALPRRVMRLINNYLIYKEIVTIKVTKLYSREQMIPVDSNESWKEFILTGDFI